MKGNRALARVLFIISWPFRVLLVLIHVILTVSEDDFNKIENGKNRGADG